MTLGRTSFGALVCAALVLRAVTVTAQDVSEVKAAFLVSFAKFAEWPADAVPEGRAFTFCVAGDKSVAAALEQSLTARPGPPAVAFMFVALDGPLRSCQLLFLGGVDSRDARRVIESLSGAPVFTVGDTTGFAELGGIAQLRIDKGRMRFAINPAAARRAHIALSAKLLSLATLVQESSENAR